MIVNNDIIRVIDASNVSMLVLLDLHAAFDTVDHDVLIEILNLCFGVVDCALDWFRSYLSGRTQSFCTATGTSKPVNLNCSVPQGSVIEPQNFIAYTGDITDTSIVFSVDHHLYADDTQLQKHMRVCVCEIQANRQNRVRCVLDVGEWCSPRRLQLNPDKTELFWFGSRTNINDYNRRTLVFELALPSSHQSIQFGTSVSTCLDSEMSMRMHVGKVLLSSTTSPPISFILTRPMRQCLASAFILSRLHYCNIVWAGLPAITLASL